MKLFPILFLLVLMACATEEAFEGKTYSEDAVSLRSGLNGQSIKLYPGYDNFPIPDEIYDSIHNTAPYAWIHFPDESLATNKNYNVQVLTHSPSTRILPNGDILYLIKNSFSEQYSYSEGVGLLIDGIEERLLKPIKLTFGLEDLYLVTANNLNPRDYYHLYRAPKSGNIDGDLNWTRMPESSFVFDDPSYPILLENLDRSVTIEIDDLDYYYFIAIERWKRNDVFSFQSTGERILSFNVSVNAPVDPLVYEIDEDFDFLGNCKSGLIYTRETTCLSFGSKGACYTNPGDHSVRIEFKGKNAGVYSGNDVEMVFAYNYIFTSSELINYFEKVFYKTDETIIKITEYGLPGKPVVGTVTGKLRSTDGKEINVNLTFSAIRNF